MQSTQVSFLSVPSKSAAGPYQPQAAAKNHFMNLGLLAVIVSIVQSSVPSGELIDVQKCISSKECKENFYCFQGTCQDNIGKPCKSSPECPSVLQCVSNICQTPRGDLVTEYGMQEYGMYCSFTRENYKCYKGLNCANNMCKSTLAEYCAYSTNCAGTKQCLNNMCHTLGPKKKLNESCSMHGDCENFNCWKPDLAASQKVCMPYNYYSSRDVVDEWLKAHNYQ